MKNLTSLLNTMRWLRNSLVVAFWLGIVCQHQAGSVSVTTFTPIAVTPEWASVSIEVAVTGVVVLDGDIPETLSISISGGYFDYGCDSLEQYAYFDGAQIYPFWVTQITDDLDITFEMGGNVPVTVHIPCWKLTGLEARMAQDTTVGLIDAANYDQDIYFKAILNPDTPPEGFTYADISWGGGNVEKLDTVWAKLADPTPGRPTISANLAGVAVNKDVWKVRVTVGEVTLKGDSTEFAELGIDPPDVNSCANTYTAPHWTTGINYDTGLNRHPVQYLAGARFKADVKFNVEPADYSRNTTVKADGTVSIGEKIGDPVSGLLTITDFEADSNPPPYSGIETINTAWKFKVGESDFSDAGTTDHEIYKTLAAPRVRPRSVAYIACNNTSVDDEDLDQAFTDIWTYFSDKQVARWNGSALSFGGGPNTPQTVDGLLTDSRGDCIAWKSLFSDIQSVHGNTVTTHEMKPKLDWIFLDDLLTTRVSDLGEMFTVPIAGQGRVTYNGPFYNHWAVSFGGQVYDPGLGEKYSDKRAWQNATFLKAKYHKFHLLPNGIGLRWRDISRWLENVPGENCTDVIPDLP